MNRRLVALLFLGQIPSVAAAGVAMFWSAGRIDWWEAWAVIAVWLVWFATEDMILLRIHPDLLAERLVPPKEVKSWDRAIVSALRLLELARYIIAGLDQRHGWTASFPRAAQAAALIACALSTALFFRAMASNAFFSQVVRIQSERSHTAMTSGPYRYIRHPGYAAVIVLELALSTLLRSGWAILIAGACTVLIALRTGLEDHALHAELRGYSDYARRVRYRLLPGVW